MGYRNLSHQVIEDSSQQNHFNNSYGTVRTPQILCCINCISVSFEFYWNFRAHTSHLHFELVLFYRWRSNQNIHQEHFLKSGLLFSLDIVLLNGVSQCSCVAQFVGSKTIVLIHSIDGNRRNTNEVMSHCGHSMRTLNFFLHCYTASISILFNNC